MAQQEKQATLVDYDVRQQSAASLLAVVLAVQAILVLLLIFGGMEIINFIGSGIAKT